MSAPKDQRRTGAPETAAPPPARYALGHHDSVLRSHRWRTAANSAAYLLAHLAAGTRILDVGCGPGTITLDFARAVGPDGWVLGLDQSESVIDEARAAASDAGIDNVEFAVGDLMDVDVGAQTFDIVHAHQVLQHVVDPVAMLRRMGRLTTADGLVAARDADYGAMTWFPSDAWLDRWLEVYRATARWYGTEPDGGRHLLSWARQAGLEQVQSSASAWCYATVDECGWWGSLQAERIVGSAITERILGADLASREDLEQMAAAWHRWAQADAAWFGILHGEILARPPRAR